VASTKGAKMKLATQGRAMWCALPNAMSSTCVDDVTAVPTYSSKQQRFVSNLSFVTINDELCCVPYFFNEQPHRSVVLTVQFDFFKCDIHHAEATLSCS